ncbi:MAG: hypothetical protein IJP63_00560 [Acholeplasmatales bacterium]|nr:hypothetical protein [Acholeplasmatales bacterium]
MSKIIKITIDSSSNSFSPFSYVDRLEFTSDYISYVKAIDGADTYEWNYNTQSKVFQKKFLIATELIEKYFNNDDDIILDNVSAFTIYLLYDNGDLKEKSFPLTFEENKMYDFMFILKDLFPTSEELPEYFFMETIDNPLLNDDVIDEE